VVGCQRRHSTSEEPCLGEEVVEYQHQEELPYSGEVAESPGTGDMDSRPVHQGAEVVVEAAGAKEPLLEERSQHHENRIRSRRHGSGPMAERHCHENHSRREDDPAVVSMEPHR